MEVVVEEGRRRERGGTPALGHLGGQSSSSSSGSGSEKAPGQTALPHEPPGLPLNGVLSRDGPSSCQQSLLLSWVWPSVLVAFVFGYFPDQEEQSD